MSVGALLWVVGDRSIKGVTSLVAACVARLEGDYGGEWGERQFAERFGGYICPERCGAGLALDLW